MQDIHFRRYYVRHLPKEVSQNDIIKALASPLINDGMVVSDLPITSLRENRIFQRVYRLSL